MGIENKSARFLRNTGPARFFVPLGVILIIAGIILLGFKTDNYVESTGTIAEVTECPRSEDEAVISIVDGGRYRSSLVSLVDPKHDRWYASWHDEGADSDHKRFAYCLQPIGFNGSMPGIESLNGVRKDFSTGRQIFDMQGHAVSPENALKGFFLVRENGQTRKVFIQ